MPPITGGAQVVKRPPSPFFLLVVLPLLVVLLRTTNRGVARLRLAQALLLILVVDDFDLRDEVLLRIILQGANGLVQEAVLNSLGVGSLGALS